jgi:hypothetical protein
MISGSQGRFQFDIAPLLGKQRGGPPMLSSLFSRVREEALFQTADESTAPWSAPSWALFVPGVFVGNVVLAILAWFVVEWTLKLM